jgi:hypothetical protein
MIVRVDCDLEELDPVFRERVLDVIVPSKYGWAIVSGYRSIAEQKVLYTKYQRWLKELRQAEQENRPPNEGLRAGKAAPPGKSAHNFRKAIDVVLDRDDNKPGLQPTWDITLPGWLWLRTTIGMTKGLKSGWTFRDWPHIEDVSWKGPRYPNE